LANRSPIAKLVSRQMPVEAAGYKDMDVRTHPMIEISDLCEDLFGRQFVMRTSEQEATHRDLQTAIIASPIFEVIRQFQKNLLVAGGRYHEAALNKSYQYLHCTEMLRKAQ